MFAGLDVIVILLVMMGFIYINSPPDTKAEIKFEPLTFMVVVIVVSMMIVSFT